ncbi:MAG: hypothetical protein QOI15_2577, partial [Pseudonocardiales bacterium]|nr:hypothetical protein [Pseudonocardiales bacterium]
GDYRGTSPEPPEAPMRMTLKSVAAAVCIGGSG